MRELVVVFAGRNAPENVLSTQAHIMYAHTLECMTSFLLI